MTYGKVNPASSKDFLIKIHAGIVGDMLIGPHMLPSCLREPSDS
jgi:hypothetical protein